MIFTPTSMRQSHFAW